MKPLALAVLLLVTGVAPLPAQSSAEGDSRSAKAAPPDSTVMERRARSEPPASPDTTLADRPATERAVGGAMVGAVVGAVLTTQDSDCAPAASAGRASLVGAVFGALRGAFGFGRARDLPLPESGDSGGEEAPYPFDGKRCEREDRQ